VLFLAKLAPELFRAALPLACQWAAEQERTIIEHGWGISPSELDDAQRAGVSSPARIKVLRVPSIPAPQEETLKHANEQMGLIGPATVGLTLHYGIFLRTDARDSRKILAHEFAHVAQYERLGGITAFLTQYLQECITYGYAMSPLEREAAAVSARICF
jgi:hypothetical protein